MAQLDIPTSGTRVQVSATEVTTTSVTFYAADANTGKVFIGDSSVSSTRFIAALDAGESLNISADYYGTGQEFDLSDFYIDAATSGDDAHVSYVTRGNP